MKRNFVFKIFLALLSFSLVTGCVAHSRELRAGSVTYQDLEGGFYGIIDEAGNQYLPIDLPPEFREDKLRVLFRAIPAQDQVGTQMWGLPVRLETIERQDP